MNFLSRVKQLFGMTDQTPDLAGMFTAESSGRPIRPNENLVIVSSASLHEIRTIINGFRERYKDDGLHLDFQLAADGQGNFAITFPGDITFVYLCYLVNYLTYPIEVNRHFEVVGWTSVRPQKGLNEHRIAGKEVMLYIPPDDSEYDTVWLVTGQNELFKIPFTSFHPVLLAPNTGRAFQSKPHDEDGNWEIIK